MARAVIDDLHAPHPRAANGADWRLIEDRVMGGVSRGTMERATLCGRPALRLRGDVRLDNDGGFVQMALDLAPDGRPVDARGWRGIALDAIGNGASYNLHLRTADTERPWQSWRCSFTPGAEWRSFRLPFDEFVAHRIAAPLDTARLRRIGIVAIGRAFAADIAVAGLCFFR